VAGEAEGDTGRGEPHPAQCKVQLASFFNAIPATSIAADVATLPETWQEIVNNGVGYICDRLS
jgi:hypothetical protein